MQVPSETLLHRRFIADNPWWLAKGDEFFVPVRAFYRAHFAAFYTAIISQKRKQIILLMGQGQTGKTVMLTQMIDKLLHEEKLDPSTIFYLPLDVPLYTRMPLEACIKAFFALFAHTKRTSLTLFLDAMHYCAGWEEQLQQLAESYPAVRWIVATSVLPSLEEEPQMLTTSFLLPPLSFSEFLHARKEEQMLRKKEEKGLKHWQSPEITSLNQQLVDYVNEGGFPATALAVKESEKTHHLIQDVIAKACLRDVPGSYGIADTQELNRVLVLLALNTGQELSLEELSRVSAIAKNTLKRYINYLEAAFFIRCLHRINQESGQFQRANKFKVYLTNPTLYRVLLGKVTAEDEAMGQLVETALVSQTLLLYPDVPLFYARWPGGEVDIVELDPATGKPSTVLEVKWRDEALEQQPKELKSLIAFAHANNFREVHVFTREKYGEMTVQNVDIRFEPISAFCYRTRQ